MNKAAVPIVTRLAALQTAAHVAPGGARVIAGFNDPSPMTALLREVNETILGRALRFESSGGSSLTLEVAGRRVLRLSEATGLPGAERCLAAPALEDEQKDDLIKLMQALAAPRSELRVTSLASTQPGDGLSVGLPVALLADLLLIDLNDSPDSEPAPPQPRAAAVEPEPDPLPPEEDPEAAPPDGLGLVRLARAMGPVLMAWLVRGGSDDGATDGPDEMVSHLQGFLEEETDAVRRQLEMLSNRPGSALCTVLGATLVDGHSVLCAVSGDAVLLGVIEGDATPALLAAWAAAQA